MIAILSEEIEEIKRVWRHCGYDITDQEIFDIANEHEEENNNVKL